MENEASLKIEANLLKQFVFKFGKQYWNYWDFFLLFTDQSIIHIASLLCACDKPPITVYVCQLLNGKPLHKYAEPWIWLRVTRGVKYNTGHISVLCLSL